MQITTIGLDIAKNVFRFTASTLRKRSSSASNFGAARYCDFSKSSRRALWVRGLRHLPLLGQRTH